MVEAMSSSTSDAPTPPESKHREDAEGNPGVDGVVDSEQPGKTTAAPSHKFQSRIGRLDKDMNWVSEIDWQATKYSKSGKSGEMSGFVMKIDDDDDPERMILLSPYIRNVFMEVVKFYPGVDFSLDSIEMVYPYPPIYHYFADMQKFVDNDKSEDRNLEDFQVLEWYYNNHLKELYNEVGSFTGLSNVSFEYLWAIFRPGDLVLTRGRLGLPQLHVLTIAELIKKQKDNYQSLPRITEHELMVKAWSVVWSPSTRTFRRSLLVFVIPQFPGSRGITSLSVYPLRFEDTSAQKKIKEELIERGNTWKKLVSKRPTCWHYKGAAFDVHDNRGPRPPGAQQLLQTINVNERVIADQVTDLNLGPMVESVRDSMAENAASTDARPEFSSYDNHHPSIDFTPFQAMLCPAVINCFCLETQKWRVVSVSLLTKVKWNKAAFNQLVLKQQTKKLLSGLVQQHARGLKGTSDFISNKGKGLTFVLYGPSGVGKTFTAESLAEHVELPLRPINISNLIASGGGPDVSWIAQIFNEAKRWDAILLIDEADVVLEKRALEDVRRNAIVSAFLRELEYFSGILFLTTNRIETMDRAFQSRIQVAVEYKPLGTNSRRQIWEAFIETLPSQEERDEIEPYVDAWKTHPLNGRQIRNVMNLARSLALNDVGGGRTLRSEHIEQAIEETLKFQELFMGWENEPKRIVNKFLPRRKQQGNEYDNEEED